MTETDQFKCRSCAAPLTITDLAPGAKCSFCGTVTPVPHDQHVAHKKSLERQDDLRQQQIQREYDRLEAWRQAEREPFMEVDSTGKRQPPRQNSTLGFALLMTGLLLTLISALVFAIAGALYFEPLLFALPVAVVLSFFPLVMPGVFMIKKAKDRFKAYSSVEKEYRRRYEELRRKHG